MGLRSRGRWRPLVPGGTNHDGGELGNAGKGVCLSYVQHRKTFAGANQRRTKSGTGWI